LMVDYRQKQSIDRYRNLLYNAASRPLRSTLAHVSQEGESLMKATTSRQRFAIVCQCALLVITSVAYSRATTLVALNTLYLSSGHYLGSSYAYAINDSGVVVGQASVNSSNMHAFMWTTSAGMTDLHTLYPDPLHSGQYLGNS